jgi:multiple sugar transport system permease protein
MLVKKVKKKGFWLLLALIVGIVVVDFPVYWMFVTSIRDEREIFSNPTILLPVRPTFANYKAVFGRMLFAKNFDLPIYLQNSLAVSFLTTLVTLLIAIPAGYGLARYPSRVSDLISTTVLFVYMFPGMVFAIPLLMFIQKLGLYDSLWSLIIAFTTFAVPFSVWMLRGYFGTIPKEIEECALIDGCSPLGVLMRISLPLAIPGVVATAAYTFLLAWNDVLYPLIFVRAETRKTLTVGISGMVYGDLTPWGGIMASSVIASVPPVLFFALLQKNLVKGLVAGAVKE